MERLSGEARDRVRAMGLWLVTALVLGGVVVAIFAIVVGFARVTPTTVHAVVRGADEREITVRYDAGSPECDRLHRVEVTESEDVVELRVYTRTREPLRGRECPAVVEEGEVEIVLDAPLGARSVRDGEREVPVLEAEPQSVSDG